jgi:hypothetical protein
VKRAFPGNLGIFSFVQKKIGNLRRKLRTKAGVHVLADVSRHRVRRKHEVAHALYGVVEKIVRPEVESIYYRVDKNWEPSPDMFRVKNAEVLVVRGDYYVVPVKRKFQHHEFGSNLEIEALTVSICL